MIEAGGGHKSTALAISEALESLYPGAADIEVVDFSAHVHALKFDAAHKATWDRMLKHPWATRFGYSLQNNVSGITRWFFRRWAADFFNLAAEWFVQNDPEIFVPTHWLNAAAAISARRRHPHLRFKHLYFLTEPFESSALHHWQGADLYLVGSAQVARQLCAAGIPPARVNVVGYPVRPSFFKLERNPEEIRAGLGCKPGRMTILLSGGAGGLGKFERFARKIAVSDLAINLVVVCGNNEKLKADLAKLAGREPLSTGRTTSNSPHIIPLGYELNINEILSACDVAALKAGPASTFEALFMNRPVLFYDYVARHEKANIDHVISREAGWYAPTFLSFKHQLKRLIEEPALVEHARSGCRNLGLENGSEAIARIIHGQL